MFVNGQKMGKALQLIKKLEAVTFDWKKTNEHDVGLIAESVVKVIPEAVYYNEKNQIAGIRLLPLVAIMVEAIKELEANNGKN